MSKKGMSVLWFVDICEIANCNNSLSQNLQINVVNIIYMRIINILAKERNIIFMADILANTTSSKISVATTLTFPELFYFFFSFAFLGKIVKVLFSFLEQLFLKTLFPAF